jgi:adenylate cyclase
MLEQALAADPGLAQTYAYLSFVRGVEYVNGWNGRTAADLDETLALARKACETDASEPLAHCALCAALMWLGRLEQAERAGRRAIELEPNSAEAHGSLGNVLHFRGRHELALQCFEQALRLDPTFELWIHAQGRTLFALGRYDEAETCFKRRLIHLPGSDVTRAYLASLYGHTGRQDEARRVWHELMSLNPEYSVEHTLRVLPYGGAAPVERVLDGLRKAGLPG